MDAISLLEKDHSAVLELFEQFHDAGDDDRREEVAHTVIRELSIHACIEEQVFYPFVREAIPKLEDEILEDLEEHHAVETMLAELERMKPNEERYRAKFAVIAENVQHHIEEEESDLFSKVRQTVGEDTLDELGEALAEAKKTAPTHPHPHSPQEPPANLVSDKVAGFLDKARDRMRSVVKG